MSYGYDAQGRMETVTSGAGVFAYGYVNDSDLLAGVEGPVVTAAYAYELNRDLRTEVHNQVGETTISRYTYRYDTIGRRRDRVQAGEAFAQTTYDKFSYNDRNEVIGSKNFEGDNPAATGDTEVTALARAFTYDPIGNRSSSKEGTASTRAYTANALNQYSAITNPSASPTHDVDGNQTVSGSGWYYEWDGENRLVLAKDYASSPTSGSKKIEFAYDYQSRRVRKVSSEYNGSAWVVEDDRKFVYQGWNLLGEFETSGFTRINAYTWGLDLSQTTSGAGGVGGLLAVVDVSDDFYPCFDANGNVTEYVDENGEVEASFIYDAFGQTTSESGSGLERFAHRFSSKYFDHSAALYYYGFRYYYTGTGRWISRDPIVEYGGLGLYAFVENNSMSSVDNMGLISYSADTSSCTVTMRFSVNLRFDDSYIQWAPGSKERFSQAFVEGVEKDWNMSTVTIRPQNDKCLCECSGGFYPRVIIELTSGKADWSPKVRPNPGKLPRRSHVSLLDEDDVTHYGQRAVSHEFGHAIGLRHPGDFNLWDSLWKGFPDQYFYKGQDRDGNLVDGAEELMGAGSKLRSFYFNGWARYLNSVYSACEFKTHE